MEEGNDKNNLGKSFLLSEKFSMESNFLKYLLDTRSLLVLKIQTDTEKRDALLDKFIEINKQVKELIGV